MNDVTDVLRLHKDRSVVIALDDGSIGALIIGAALVSTTQVGVNVAGSV